MISAKSFPKSPTPTPPPDTCRTPSARNPPPPPPPPPGFNVYRATCQIIPTRCLCARTQLIVDATGCVRLQLLKRVGVLCFCFTHTVPRSNNRAHTPNIRAYTGVRVEILCTLTTTRVNTVRVRRAYAHVRFIMTFSRVKKKRT